MDWLLAAALAAFLGTVAGLAAFVAGARRLAPFAAGAFAVAFFAAALVLPALALSAFAVPFRVAFFFAVREDAWASTASLNPPNAAFKLSKAPSTSGVCAENRFATSDINFSILLSRLRALLAFIAP